MTDLIAIGETMALFTGSPVGPLRHATSTTVGAVGAESTVAVGARRLGVPSTWLGRVGTDELGELVLSRLRGAGVDVASVVRDPEAPTGVMIKEHRTSSVTRVWYYRRGSAGSRLCPEDLDEQAIRAARVLHVSGITPALSDTARAAVFAAVDIARASDTLVSLDYNYRSALWDAAAAAPVLTELTRRADIVFADQDEAAIVVDNAKDPVPRLAGMGPRHVVLKLGSLGARALVDRVTYDQPAFDVAAVDPVGAGDAFVAGYLSVLLAGGDAQACLERGCLTAAFAISVPGDWEGLPDLAELNLLRLRSGTVLR